MYQKTLLFLVFVIFVSCDKEYKTPEEISNIDMDVSVKRFDKEFYDVRGTSFENLANKYPFFVNRNVKNVDSIWFLKRNDTLEIEVLEETLKVFPDLAKEEADLSLLFKHIKYYYPQFYKPNVIALTTQVKYRTSVLLQNNILLISLDCYLGVDHKFYEGISKFLAKNFNRAQIVSDVAGVYANKYMPIGRQRVFRDVMIAYGKQLYLKDLFMPFESEASRIGYTEDELLWAKNNESQIWSYFLEKELFDSTDMSLSKRFINPAPFSKFYLELDSESPGMLGRYLGWQIVRSYMEKNNVSLSDLANISGEELFSKSKYKPAK